MRIPKSLLAALGLASVFIASIGYAQDKVISNVYTPHRLDLSKEFTCTLKYRAACADLYNDRSVKYVLGTALVPIEHPQTYSIKINGEKAVVSGGLSPSDYLVLVNTGNVLVLYEGYPYGVSIISIDIVRGVLMKYEISVDTRTEGGISHMEGVYKFTEGGTTQLTGDINGDLDWGICKQ